MCSASRTAYANTALLSPHSREKNLPELSTLGHFLKGSSAAVGVIKVRDSCENMQHYGKSRDKDGVTELSEEEALKRVVETLESVKIDYKEAEAALRGFFDAHEKAAEEAEGEEEAAAAEATDANAATEEKEASA